MNLCVVHTCSMSIKDMNNMIDRAILNFLLLKMFYRWDSGGTLTSKLICNSIKNLKLASKFNKHPFRNMFSFRCTRSALISRQRKQQITKKRPSEGQSILFYFSTESFAPHTKFRTRYTFFFIIHVSHVIYHKLKYTISMILLVLFVRI